MKERPILFSGAMVRALHNRRARNVFKPTQTFSPAALSNPDVLGMKLIADFSECSDERGKSDVRSGCPALTFRLDQFYKALGLIFGHPENAGRQNRGQVQCGNGVHFAQKLCHHKLHASEIDGAFVRFLLDHGLEHLRMGMSAFNIAVGEAHQSNRIEALATTLQPVLNKHNSKCSHDSKRGSNCLNHRQPITPMERRHA